VQRVIAVLGTPNAEDLAFIGNESALKYIKSLPKRTRQPWKNLYPKANSQALDLLGKMLIFNPDKRYTVEECLAHPYLEGLHNPEDEPVCEEPFDWSVDNFEPTKELLQEIVYDEACKYHPN
jgi:mitogen-activated protein kinase 1/3